MQPAPRASCLARAHRNQHDPPPILGRSCDFLRGDAIRSAPPSVVVLLDNPPASSIASLYTALLSALPLAGCVVDWSLAKHADAAMAASETTPDADIPLDLDASDTNLAPEADDAGSEPALEQDADEADAALENEPPARDAAIAKAGLPCANPLELACTEHNVPQKLACVSRVWTFNGSCDGQARCDTRFGATQGTCQAITAHCLAKPPGAAFCDGLERKLCGADLLDELPAPCGANAHCDPSDGGCLCDRGFTPDQDAGCQDIVDCPAGACSPGGRCVDRVETFECACDVGYQPSADKKSCVDVDDCTGVSCGTGGTCRDRVHDYECSCLTGYTLAADKKSCSDVTNDCRSPDTCSPGRCVDLPNGYTCECPPGTTLFDLEGWRYCISACPVPCSTPVAF
jgi:hypothetical protein